MSAQDHFQKIPGTRRDWQSFPSVNSVGNEGLARFGLQLPFFILAAFEKGEQAPLEAVSQEYEAPSLARAEWEHINRVLSDVGGNISEAARRLGMHRRSLQRKLQKFPPQL